MSLVPMTYDDAANLRPQEFQDDCTEAERISIIMAQAANGPAWAYRHHGETVAVGGLIDVWDGRAIAWATLSDEAGACMLQMTRELRRMLAAYKARRIEIYVDAGFASGMRWAQLLGFEIETPNPMRGFCPNGNDAYMFARVR